MPPMDTSDIEHLAALARIKLTAEEIESFQADLESIVAYVGAVSEIAASGSSTPTVGARANVYREDDVTNADGSYTDALVAEMPETDGNYLKVRKILKAE